MELYRLTFFTDDVSSTATFYQRLLGAKPVLSKETIAIFEFDGVKVVIHETYDADEGDVPPEDYAAFTVENLDERFSELVDEGLEPFREPAEYDRGRSAYLRDPDGRIIELTEK